MAKAKIDELREYYDNTDLSEDIERAEFVPADAPPASERMTTFAVRLPVPVLNRVRELAGEGGVTTSEIVRQWIEDGITAADQDEGDDETMVSVDLVRALLDAVSMPASKVRTAIADLAQTSTIRRRPTTGRYVVRTVPKRAVTAGTVKKAVKKASERQRVAPGK